MESICRHGSWPRKRKLFLAQYRGLEGRHRNRNAYHLIGPN
jgi:hypothetical protein